MNLSSIRDRVRALTGIRLETIRSDEQIDVVINESYHEVINLSAWPFLASSQNVAVAAGQETFQTPTGFSEVNSVFFVDGSGDKTRLQQTSIEEIDSMDDQEGLPFFYARVSENTFRMWPVTEAAITLTVRGKQSVNNLSTDSSEPVFGDQFHPIIAYRTASKLLAEEADESNRAELYQGEASAIFARMQQFYTRSADKGMFVLGGAGKRRRTLDAY